MLTQIVWWTVNFLIALLIVRALTQHFFKKYLAFYLYLCHVLIISFLRFYLHTFQPRIYGSVFWYTEFFSIAIGYCIIWEVYDRALTGYPGSLMLARWLIIGVFISVVAKALSNSVTGPAWGSATSVWGLERDFRTVQAILLLLIAGVLSYYLIPVGRNLRGIIAGYGFYIGSGLIYSTVRSNLGNPSHLLWRHFQPLSYFVTLAIWVVALWRYNPNPAPVTAIEIERDYELLSTRTAQAVSRARAQVLRGVRG
jgi:hypothetical protein